MSENRNPKGLKRGDKIIVINSQNGIPAILWGTTFTITSNPNARSKTITVNADEAVAGQARTWTVYLTGDYYDAISLADRKSQAKAARARVTELKKELKEMEARAFELEKFETDEDFVAHKLAKIFKAGTDEQQMAKLLKEMKASNLL